MATKQDYAQLTILSKRLRDQSIIGCSLDTMQLRILRAKVGFRVSNFTQDQWDLNNPAPKTADIVVACNVFHYSPNPTIWFDNVFRSCQEFWMQDLFSRRRGSPTEEFGTDGDCCRYAFGTSVTCAKTFNLEVYRDRLLEYYTYDAGSFEGGYTLVNFIARFEGDL